MILSVTGKNQITLPAKLMRQLDIQSGSRLLCSVDDGVIVLRPLPARAELAKQAAGMGKDWLAPGQSAVADLMTERGADEGAA